MYPVKLYGYYVWQLAVNICILNCVGMLCEGLCIFLSTSYSEVCVCVSQWIMCMCVLKRVMNCACVPCGELCVYVSQWIVCVCVCVCVEASDRLCMCALQCQTVQRSR